MAQTDLELLRLIDEGTAYDTGADFFRNVVRALAQTLGVRMAFVTRFFADNSKARMVAWWNREVIDVPLADVVGRSRVVERDGTLVRTARALGICLGDRS